MMKSLRILNVRLDVITQDELLKQLRSGVIVTPNLDHIVLCQKNEEFHRNAAQAEYSVCDSRILQIMTRIAGKPIKEVIPGSGFFHAYCDYHAKDENVRIFMLGAREGVAEMAKQKINCRIGREMVVGTYSPPFGFEKDEEECNRIVDILRSSTANVVLVGLGNSKQTNWIYRYKGQLPNIDLFMALGATIDFEAGTIKRAPEWVQKVRMEWFYRFLEEPRRLFKRYFVDDMQFFYYFVQQLLGVYVDPFKGGGRKGSIYFAGAFVTLEPSLYFYVKRDVIIEETNIGLLVFLCIPFALMFMTEAKGFSYSVNNVA